MRRKTRFELETDILEKEIEIESKKSTIGALCVLLYDVEELILEMSNIGRDLPWGDKMRGRIDAIVDKIRTSRDAVT